MDPKNRPEHARASAWENGWYRLAHHLASPNFGARPAGTQVDLVVLHSISLPPGRFGGNEVQELFTNRLDWEAHPYFKQIEGLKVSSHFYIRRTGVLWQFVSCKHRAWHAGASHYRGRSNCNDDSIGIELEGLEGTEFEPAQYEILSTLCQEILLYYPIAHIAGHEHIAPGRKCDPGPGLDWTLLQKGLGLSDRYFPASVITRSG